MTGYALKAPTEPSMFEILHLGETIHHVDGDVRDFAHLKQVFDETKPEIVLHLAAQPIVRESYRDPVGTYAANVMGTVHVLECARQCESVRSLVNVTTDKVYENKEWLAAAGGIFLLSMLLFFDPSTSALFPPCPTNALTSLHCPGCGTLRALHALLRGDLREAFSQNALAVLFLPVLPAAYFFPVFFRKPAVPAIILAIFIAYAILRNTQTFSFLAPH